MLNRPGKTQFIRPKSLRLAQGERQATMPSTKATGRQAPRAARSAGNGNGNMLGQNQNRCGQCRMPPPPKTDTDLPIVASLIDVNATATIAITDNNNVMLTKCSALVIRRLSPPLNARRPGSKSLIAFGRTERCLRANTPADKSPCGLQEMLHTGLL